MQALNRKIHATPDIAGPAKSKCEKAIRKGFVRTSQGQVHYRKAGQGPAVVLLHDSPRSSRLHIDTIEALSARYTVFALDTPGYGMSDPLPIAQPAIEDFARALGDALEALGLADAPLYATHTSAKIALEYAAQSDKPPRLILDGLSIPDSLAPDSFVDAYMRPFRVEPTGAYLAAEWQRIRDMLRWFPWFSPVPANRMAMDRPDDAWIEQYTIDLFSAAGHYSDAYGAAMRYDPAAALRNVKVPTVVAARSNDVLYGFLDKVPLADNPALSVERPEPERDAWLAWLADRLDMAASPLAASATGACGDDTLEYVEAGHGQILIRRSGSKGDAFPLLILELPGPLSALAWQRAIADRRQCILPELPGFGESEPLGSDAGMEALVRSLQSVVARVGGAVDVLAIGHAGALGAALAASGDFVRRIIFDGAPDHAVDAADLCPNFSFSTAGAHLHEIFHMLRDGQVQYPWFEGSATARRLTEPVLDADPLHRLLTGILKQPGHYGEAMAISLSAPPAAANSDALVFALPEDPFYARAQHLADRLPHSIVRSRPAAIGDAAALVEQFLTSVQPIAAGN